MHSFRPLGYPLLVVLLSVFPVLGRYISPADRILLQKQLDSKVPALVATFKDELTNNLESRMSQSPAITDFIQDLVKRQTFADAASFSSSTSSSMSSDVSSSTRSFDSDDGFFFSLARAAMTRTNARSERLFGTDKAPSTEEYVTYTNSSYGVCGHRPLTPLFVHRIVAGGAAADRWPWQVNLIDATTGEPFCGGTLITNEHVLTAAHCFVGRNPRDVIIRLGDFYLDYWDRSEQNFSVGCLHVHHRFNLAQYRHDIALIKLNTDDDHRVEINEHVTPACMPEPGEFDPGQECYITGWGYTSFTDWFLQTRPNTLQEAQVPLLSNRDCKTKTAYGTRVRSKMVCAGVRSGEAQADTCKGDSGGPLVCRKGPDGPFKLVGITSWGDNIYCNPQPKLWVPGVYTRVDKYMRWIQRKLRTRKCS